MKNILRLFTLAILVGFVSNSLAQEMVQGENNMIGEPYQASIKKHHKKDVLSDWFDFIDAGREFGISWTRITNTTLFPDTLVYQLYGDGNGGTYLGKTGLHSIGQMFDPKDEYVFLQDPRALTKHNPYIVDSVRIWYRYTHQIPGSVDTLLVQFYDNSKIQKTTLQGSGRICATVGYDKAGNRGSSPSGEEIILLDEDDTSVWSDNSLFAIQTIAVGSGMNIPADGLFGVSMSYIPGYEYSEGDTIEHDWEGGAPDKKLNHFRAARFQDREQLMSVYESYNSGFSATRSSRYTSATWNNRYIPGHAWTTYDQSYYVEFHITSNNVSVPEIGSDVKIYPNPSVQTPTILEGELKGANLVVYDLTGKIVLQDTLDVFNEIDLKMGTYIFEISKDEQTSRHRIVKY